MFRMSILVLVLLTISEYLIAKRYKSIYNIIIPGICSGILVFIDFGILNHILLAWIILIWLIVLYFILENKLNMRN